MTSGFSSLLEIYRELYATVERVRLKRSRSRRRTRKQAEIGILLTLYADVLIILERILREQVELEAFSKWIASGGAGEAAKAMEPYWEHHHTTIQQVRVDILSLYQWAYAIENALRAFGKSPDLSELERLSIFRSKLVVHPAETSLHRSRDVAVAGMMLGRTGDDLRILSHPFHGRDLLRGYRTQLRRLEGVIPGLKDQPNQFEKIDLIYIHYGRITDGKLREWVRNRLFDRTGLKSDPPRVVAAALLNALNDFRRRRRL